MFLFKNSKSIITRTGLNMIVYGLIGVFIIMLLALVLPQSSSAIIYYSSIAFSMWFTFGLLACIAGFVLSFFGLPAPKSNKTENVLSDTKKIKAEIFSTKQVIKEKVFKLRLGDDPYFMEYRYLNQVRYSPNISKTSGYGEDNWMYLCESQDSHYILSFTDDASCGTYWMTTKLNPEDDVNTLRKKDAEYWRGIAFGKNHYKQINVYLSNIDGVRHLLPKISRCHSPLKDEHFLR